MKEVCEKYKEKGICPSAQIDKYKNHATVLFECKSPENCEKIYNYMFERKIYFHKIGEGKYLLTTTYRNLPLVRYYLNLILEEMK